MEFPEVDLDRLIDRVRRTVEASEIEEGTAYIHVTRGVAPRAHAYPKPARAADRADRRPTLRRRGHGVEARGRRRRWSPVPTSAGSGATSSRRTSWPTSWPSNRPTGPGPTRRSWSTPTGWSPRRPTRRSSGSATAGSRGRPTTQAILPGTTRFLTQRLAGRAGDPVRPRGGSPRRLPPGSTRPSWSGRRSRSCRSSRSTADRSATAAPARSPVGSRRVTAPGAARPSSGSRPGRTTA